MKRKIDEIREKGRVGPPKEPDRRNNRRKLIIVERIYDLLNSLHLLSSKDSAGTNLVRGGREISIRLTMAWVQVKELSFDGRLGSKSLEEKSKRRKRLDTMPRG